MSQTQTVFSNFSTNVLNVFQALGDGSGKILKGVGGAFKSLADDALKAVTNIVSGVVSETVKIVAAKQVQAIASVIASVMVSIPFPLNIAWSGAGIAAVLRPFPCPTPGRRRYRHRSYAGPRGRGWPGRPSFPSAKWGKAGMGGGMQIHMTNHFHGDIKTDADIETFSAKMGLKIQQAIMRGRRGA